MHRTCKAGITNLLLENYKRVKEGKEIIPALFCMDIVDNEFSPTTKSVTAKDVAQNNLVTHSELRRCYKLCRELENSEHVELREMAEIARQMFKFVKIVKKGDKAALEKIPALWELPGFSEAMQTRKEVTPKWKVELKAAENAESSAKNKYQEAVNAEASANEKYEFSKLESAEPTAKSKMTTRHAKHDKEAIKDAFEVLQSRKADVKKADEELQKKHAEVQNLQASVIGSKYHSGKWREELLRAAKDYDFDSI
jgi:hypothetical protein